MPQPGFGHQRTVLSALSAACSANASYLAGKLFQGFPNSSNGGSSRELFALCKQFVANERLDFVILYHSGALGKQTLEGDTVAINDL